MLRSLSWYDSFHFLWEFGNIIPDKVTRSIDTPPGEFSLQERKTINAIVRARWSLIACSLIIVSIDHLKWV